MARQNFIGFVVSQGKMDKTIKVRILQKVYNSKVQKEYMKRKDFLVHDEDNICREGDLVRIEATRPLSARKFFAVAEIKANAGQQFAKYQEEATRIAREEEIEKTKGFENRRQLNRLNETEKRELYEDLKELRQLRLKSNIGEEDQSIIEQLKSRYGLNTFKWLGETFQSNTDELLLHQENKTKLEKEEVDEETKLRRAKDELFVTEIQLLTEKLSSVELNLKTNQVINDLLNNEEKSEILQKVYELAGVDESTKANIKKNKIKKFLKNASKEQLNELSINLD